jgi:hypothetical protein
MESSIGTARFSFVAVVRQFAIPGSASWDGSQNTRRIAALRRSDDHGNSLVECPFLDARVTALVHVVVLIQSMVQRPGEHSEKHCNDKDEARKTLHGCDPFHDHRIPRRVSNLLHPCHFRSGASSEHPDDRMSLACSLAASLGRFRADAS